MRGTAFRDLCAHPQRWWAADDGVRACRGPCVVGLTGAGGRRCRGRGRRDHDGGLPLLPQSVILVTGGSGLVGRAIEHVITTSPDPRYRKRDDETWIFLTSKDGDLRYTLSRLARSLA